MELAYTIPIEWRLDSKFYNAALLYHFPDFYRSIPWASTGIALGKPKIVSSTIQFYHRITNRLLRDLNKVGVHTHNNWAFSDYDKWIRNPVNRIFFDTLFNNKDAIYPEYLDKNAVLKSWAQQQNGANQARLIGAYASIEIYFQQLFNQKYLGLAE
jgi:hypothetical protein